MNSESLSVRLSIPPLVAFYDMQEKGAVGVFLFTVYTRIYAYLSNTHIQDI
jgi:hypothetical protein